MCLWSGPPAGKDHPGGNGGEGRAVCNLYYADLQIMPTIA
jgi:hypothetical protein